MILTTRRLFVSILFVALFVMATREISDPDFWWHLRTGQYVVETGSVPHVDIFSFTRAGAPWVAHEWLSEVLIYVVFRLGSFPALSIAFSALITLAFGLVWARCDGKPYVAAFPLLLAALATAPMWGVRPQIISFILSALYFFLLDHYRRRREIRWLLALPPLMLLWVNLHSGYALGLTFVGIYVIGTATDQWFATRRDRIPVESSGRETPNPSDAPTAVTPLILALVACILVVPLNPNGATMYIYPFETLTSHAMQTYIQEWFSPDLHLSEFQPFAWLLLLTLVALALSPRRARITDALLLAFTGYASLLSARHIPLFALVAAPVLAEHSTAFLKDRGWGMMVDPRATLRPVLHALNWALLVLIAGAALFRMGAVLANQSAAVQAKFPVAAVEYVKSAGLSGHMYNEYGWGGYLIWQLAPQGRVFIDGRADVYGDQLIEEYLATFRGEPQWQASLDRQDVRLVLIEPDSPLASELNRNPIWARVYSDALAVLYQRK